MKRFISRITVAALVLGSLAAFGGTTASAEATPIKVYVDAVLGSGAAGVVEPAPVGVCALTGNFVLGQTIVFRAYANDVKAGAALTSLNTASATISIAGVATPIPLAYGSSADSDGRVWWTANLSTGEALGQYNTLGAIPFTVTFIAKDTSQKVKSTKLVKLIKNGKVVVKNGKAVLKRVAYYKIIKVKGATGAFNSNAVPVTSQATLHTNKVVPAASGTTGVFGADQWLTNHGAFKDAGNWALAGKPTLTLSAGAINPASLDLVAGLPYEILIKNTDTVALGFDGRDFFRASAVRKVQASPEMKIVLFKEIFVKPGQSLRLFIQPVVPGTYVLNGLDATGAKVTGMVGSVNVTGALPPTFPAPVFQNVSTTGEIACASNLISAAIPTWDAKAVKATILMDDTSAAAGYFMPQEIVLKLGVPVILTFENKGLFKHVYELKDFFKTVAFWKSDGAEGWVIGALPRPADAYPLTTLNLYFIPTVAGTYQWLDSAAGMSSIKNTIIVK